MPRIHVLGRRLKADVDLSTPNFVDSLLFSMWRLRPGGDCWMPAPARRCEEGAALRWMPPASSGSSEAASRNEPKPQNAAMLQQYFLRETYSACSCSSGSFAIPFSQLFLLFLCRLRLRHDTERLVVFQGGRTPTEFRGRPKPKP